LLAGKEKIPLAPVDQDRHGHAVMESVFEELALGAVALSNLLDLDERSASQVDCKAA
jgi:hypothetical protein